MASKLVQRLTLAAVLIGGLGLLDAQTAAAARPVRRTARPEAARGFNLFAGAVNVMMNTNRIQCNINNIGEQCVDPTNSSVVGGGYWPKGTPDQYIFNGGLQVSAIIPGVKTATFSWPGDTVGAFFFDPRGDQAAGQGLTNVYNSLNATDLAEWPTAAYVNDPTLFNLALLGRKTVSQQDTWVRYWDGSVNLLTGRQHPMGVLVDQRAMMWNFPSGNQDIMYFLIRFINITANDATRYDGLSAYGYSGDDIARIVQIARDFRAASQAQFNVMIPDTGYTFANMYAGYGQDPDLGSSGVNYSTANLPFAMGFVYKANESEPTWSYPANTFGGLFAAAPGMEGVKYLKSPTNPATGRPFGITMFTNTTNGVPFPDRFGVQAMWRLASNNLQAQDGACNSPINTPLCQLVQTYADTRFTMFSGPMTIKPGESAVIVVGIVHAAPVATAIATDGAGHALGSSSYDMKPGFPGTPTGFVSRYSRAGQTRTDTVRNIDRATGWVSAGADVAARDLNADGFLDQTEIPTVPRSLLHKSLVAQAVFDANFLLPFSPEGPTFFLVPGDNQVTVVWQPSATESLGDPYFAVASAALSSLYDPNFRKFDVEGYRIWRGRTEAEMQVLASFDYAGTTITDHTGGFFYPSNPQCAPELALMVCPVAFNANGSGPSYNVPLSGNVVQIPTGNRTKLSDNTVYILNADTAVVGGGHRLAAAQRQRRAVRLHRRVGPEWVPVLLRGDGLRREQRQLGPVVAGVAAHHEAGDRARRFRPGGRRHARQRGADRRRRDRAGRDAGGPDHRRDDRHLQWPDAADGRGRAGLRGVPAAAAPERQRDGHDRLDRARCVGRDRLQQRRHTRPLLLHGPGRRGAGEVHDRHRRGWDRWHRHRHQQQCLPGDVAGLGLGGSLRRQPALLALRQHADQRPADLPVVAEVPGGRQHGPGW